MQENPNERPKPRFLAKDDGKNRPAGTYRGRFLNRQTPEDDAPPSQEADIFGEAALPEQGADIPSETSEPAQDAAAPETFFDPENADDTQGDGLPFSENPEDTDAADFEEPIDPEFTLPYEEEASGEYAEDTLPSDAPLSEDDAEFQELFNAEPPQEDDIPVREHPAPKGRPKRRGGEGFLGIPNILVTIVWIAITVAIGVTLGRMAWVCAADVLAFGREDTKVTITISSTDDIDAIAQKLKNAGLIRYPGLFKLYASFAVDEGEIQPGIWDLNTLYDYHALVNMMSPSSKRSVVTIMIPEGSQLPPDLPAAAGKAGLHRGSPGELRSIR